MARPTEARATDLGATTAWTAERPSVSADYRRDAAAFSRFWLAGSELLAGLPTKARRSAAEAAVAGVVLRTGRETREQFLAAHATTVYRALTRDHADFIRVEKIVYDAARLLPGLTPAPEEVAAESALPQGDKDGVEIDQGIFLSRVLADPASGAHLCHAMLLPRAEALERVPEFRARGVLDLGAGCRRAARQGRRGHDAQSALPQRRGRDHDRRGARSRSISRRSIRGRRSRCCAATWSSIRNTAAGASSPPASTSRTSITARFPTSGTSSATWGWSTRSSAALARPDASPDELDGGTHREALGRRGRHLRDRRRLPDPAGDGLRHRRRATPT